MADQATATLLQLCGAFFFGMLLGWYLYYINRYRKEEIKLNDLITLIGALGGATVLALFPAESDLFGAYGTGLAVGFFGYFAVLVILVHLSKGDFTSSWFLDGRKKVGTDVIVPGWTKLPDGTLVSGDQKAMGKDNSSENKPADPPAGQDVVVEVPDIPEKEKGS
jgi:hypothetical protein